MEYKTETHRYKQQHGGYHREVGGKVVKDIGGLIHGDGGWFDLNGGHIMQYAEHVS